MINRFFLTLSKGAKKLLLHRVVIANPQLKIPKVPVEYKLFIRRLEDKGYL